MSDMTHPEFLRRNAEEMPRERLYAIADRLDAMTWRKEPPDGIGNWLIHRKGLSTGDWQVVVIDHWPLSYDLALKPGDLWLKLPEVKN